MSSLARLAGIWEVTMTVVDKTKAFFKRLKPKAKAPEKKAVEPAETKAAETPEKKPGESS